MPRTAGYSRARMLQGVALAVAVALALAATSPRSTRAAPGELTGPLPASGGLAVVVWGGGPLAQLEAAAAAEGCELRSAWANRPAGGLVGHVFGAPIAVNTGFVAAYPGPLAADTPLVLVCLAAVGSLDLELTPALGGRAFERPVEVGAYPGGRFFVAEQDGTVRLTPANGASVSTLLDISARVRTAGNEEGLLSFALDPAFAANGYAYAYYSASNPSRTVLSRFRVVNDTIDALSELVLLEQEQPFSNHNGGSIRFGPDGLLYLGLGDGGSAGDPRGNGQNPRTLLGTVVRLDVRAASSATPYLVPASNPLIAGTRTEVYAYGLRNPWRMAFDAATGALWAGDVGQRSYEEVDVIRAGANYGWNRLEGRACFEPPSGCVAAGTVLPEAVYDHGNGCSITGGVVYRGSAIPALRGHYLYGDFCSGRLWALPVNAEGATGAPIELLDTALGISTFGVDAAGEVYLADHGGGRIYRLIAR